MSSLNDALKQFEATEANLVKLEALWEKIKSMIPESVSFGDMTDGVYDDCCRDYRQVREALPKIDGWTMPDSLLELNEIGQFRFDAMEIGDFESAVIIDEHIFSPEKDLKEYRYRLNRSRRTVFRHALLEEIRIANLALARLRTDYPSKLEANGSVDGDDWEVLVSSVSRIDTILGSSAKRPPRWGDLKRHLHYGMIGDLRDIIKHDWPAVDAGMTEILYGSSDPLPVAVDDLGELVKARPVGEIATKLNWEAIDEDDFERLVFNLISQTEGYENAEWLTKTNASDRGRDLSCQRVFLDKLGGTFRLRVIIQCKHWLSKSVGAKEIATLREQMKLWEPPRVDVHIIATSGRFSTDAIQIIENHNQSDSALRIEMWADSHLESLLARRPGLIGEFRLR
tara:strand:+ start:19 stop:1209 length:1191 start_codon:yes stop_codon:yes gene_type:complete